VFVLCVVYCMLCVFGVVCVCVLYEDVFTAREERVGERSERFVWVVMVSSPTSTMGPPLPSQTPLGCSRGILYIRSFQLSKVQLCRSYYMPKYRLHLLH